MSAIYLRKTILVVLILITFVMIASGAQAKGKVGLYVLYMRPNGADAEDYSDPGWGGGLHVVLPVPQVHNYFAGTAGLEIVNLLSQTIEFQDRVTLLRVEQQTSQNYFRFYIGGRLGAHGRGFIRPFVGVNLAAVHYRIDTDVVIPDDSDRENEIRQNLESEGNTVFGFDITIGGDMNFYQKVTVEGGVRYMKSFSVPQQLGGDAVDVSPEYFQIYLGAGYSFDY